MNINDNDVKLIRRVTTNLCRRLGVTVEDVIRELHESVADEKGAMTLGQSLAVRVILSKVEDMLK